MRSCFQTAAWLALTFALLALWPALAQQPTCNCEKIIGSCSARVKLDVAQSLAHISASTQQCAKVTYYLDSTPGVVVFHGGAATDDVVIYDKSKPPAVSNVQCMICETQQSSTKMNNISTPGTGCIAGLVDMTASSGAAPYAQACQVNGPVWRLWCSNGRTADMDTSVDQDYEGKCQ